VGNGQRSKDRDQKVKNYPLSGFSSPSEQLLKARGRVKQIYAALQSQLLNH